MQGLASAIFHSLHLDYLWVSVNQHQLQKEAFLLMSERCTGYGYDCKSLGLSLITCRFSRIIVDGSPFGPMTCLVIGSWTQYQCQVWVSTCDMGFKLNQKLIGYSQDIFVTIIPRDLCRQEDCKFQLSGSIQHLKALGKPDRKNEASLCSMTQVSNVFNRVCPSVSGGCQQHWQQL